MPSQIRQTFKSLEEKLAKLLQELDSMSPDTVCFKAGADKWSIVEAIEHLVMAEENMLAQLTTSASTVDLDPQDRSAKNFQIVIKVMERDIPVDVPDESMEPHGEFNLEELLERWKAVRRETGTHIEAIGQENAADLVYRHPFAGPLDMAETLRFFDVHFDNHMRHLETIKARAK
jgi:hypothetical protein